MFLQVIFSFFAFPAFAKKYGYITPDGSYQVAASWQTGLTNGTGSGEMIGLALTGVFADKYGQRWTIIGALILVVRLNPLLMHDLLPNAQPRHASSL